LARWQNPPSPGYDYAAAPTREKDCDFVFPETAGSPPTATAPRAVDHPVAFAQRGGTVNDASCLNKTAIHGIVRVSSIDEVRNALRFARESHLKVTSAGQRHSMGAQSFTRDGLVLDMRGLAAMSLDKERRLLTVQAGATWEKVQHYLDKDGLAVKAMQSINIFTVGGTLSVNAHGIAHSPGPIAPTVRSIRVMLSNGQIKTASAGENSELFRHALGGYGLFGVILDAEIEVVANEMYRWDTAYVTYKDFPAHYRKQVRRVSVLRGRRCCAGCSPLTPFSARAAAAGAGSWACTPGARACVAGSSGSGSPARHHPRRRRARRRERKSNRTRPSRSVSLGPMAPDLSSSSAPACVRALAAPGFCSTRAGLPTARHRSEHRPGASLLLGA